MEGHLERLLASGELRPEDAETIQGFLEWDAKRWGLKKKGNFIKARSGKKVDKATGEANPTGKTNLTIEVRARYLTKIARMLPAPLKDCDTKQIHDAIDHYGEDHSQNTVRMALVYLIMLLKWMKSENINIADIAERVPPQEKSSKQPEDMLNANEIEALIRFAGNSRDRALISVLYESACRPIELSRLQWENVIFDDFGAILKIKNTKEAGGDYRHVRLISSVGPLAAWKQDSKATTTGPVFTDIRVGHKIKGGIGTHNINVIIQSTAKRAGVREGKEERIHGYLMRHTRVSHLLEDGVHESVVKLLAWGNLSTPMIGTYGHMKNKTVDKALLEHAGIKQPDTKEKSAPQSMQCPRCMNVNAIGARFCSLCGSELTEETVQDMNAVVTRLRDEEIIMNQDQRIKAMETKINLLLELQSKNTPQKK